VTSGSSVGTGGAGADGRGLLSTAIQTFAAVDIFLLPTFRPSQPSITTEIGPFSLVVANLTEDGGNSACTESLRERITNREARNCPGR
jgi:hypothetical protein